MIIALAALALLLSGSLALNVFFVRKNLSLVDQRDGLVDQIETSLDDLDTCYSNVSRYLTMPVLSDEPVIRNLINDIKQAKNAIHAIAGRVVMYGSDEESGR